MIARLEGTLRGHVSATPPKFGIYRFVLDVAGVGYLVTTSGITAARLAIGFPTTLLIVTRVSENAISLFGFDTAEEQRLFELLCDVKNVGPTTALLVLSARSEVRPVAKLIADGDAATLKKIKNVGEKTADALIAGLAEKLREELEAGTL